MSTHIRSPEGNGPSVTARRVAAHRLGFSRVPAPYGAPAADEALAADVAAGLVAPANRMHDYLAARTSFFDRTVVSAIDRGVRQVVVGAAGYDGRAFRYAKPGVRWFEVDHPGTQRDTNRYPLDGIPIRRFSTARTTWAAVDYGVILPRAHALYAHAASELNEPRLLEMLRDGRPVYAWPYGAGTYGPQRRHHWRLTPPGV